ncbi:n-alpha-acetyltransferase 30 [Caerostris darwini]|uniref:N-terminal methionine N(alpha)-acetyltransferase NatC n=2 Tax=Caerostris TaxID=172845 RepID=A0AAV4VWK7_9ARAC|nr:n-alpha-acetyltransferase 30 [Caerostris extrusa]GIY74513.1 n-alpha-acetyltransferase 30 [Caerostris darwini]
MDDHSAVDINIRNVDVRLNDSNNLSSEINGECVNSLYIPSSIDNETQVTHFNDDCDEKCHTNHSDVADEIRDKLHICKDSARCALINGCNKLVHGDMKHVDLCVNGLNKGSSFELLSTHFDKLTHRTYEQSSINSENQRTENESNESDTISRDNTLNCLTSETPSPVSTDTSLSSQQCDQIDEKDQKDIDGITYLGYESEKQMPDIMRLIQKDLSEPYSIYTYRYFIHNWPKLCFLAHDGDRCVGAIVCKLDVHKKQNRRGYIAMLAVDENYRKRRIGSNLVLKAIRAMDADKADEVVLETEITNKPALRLYENLGFVRDKRLFRYYLNGVDALRLKLWLR